MATGNVFDRVWFVDVAVRNCCTWQKQSKRWIQNTKMHAFPIPMLSFPDRKISGWGTFLKVNIAEWETLHLKIPYEKAEHSDLRWNIRIPQVLKGRHISKMKTEHHARSGFKLTLGKNENQLVVVLKSRYYKRTLASVDPFKPCAASAMCRSCEQLSWGGGESQDAGGGIDHFACSVDMVALSSCDARERLKTIISYTTPLKYRPYDAGSLVSNCVKDMRDVPLQPSRVSQQQTHPRTLIIPRIQHVVFRHKSSCRYWPDGNLRMSESQLNAVCIWMRGVA